MRRLAACLLALAAVVAAPPAVAGDIVLLVVVHPTRADSLSVAEVERIFLRKRRFWADGSPIVPLNREVGSAEREAFTTRVLADGGAHLSQYWNEQYFAGIFPPTMLSSSAAVLRYVAADPGAVGYVRAEEVDGSVRVALTLRAAGDPREAPSPAR